ncbi:MAG: hypothetical protein ACI4MI_00285 [Christensenellales bacterium]
MAVDKNKTINALLKVILALSLVFSSWWSIRSFSNILPYTSEGQQLLSLVSSSYATMLFSVVMPLLSAAIFYAIYMFLERSVLRSLGHNLDFFGRQFDSDWHVRLVEICAIIIAIVLGVAEIIWTYYPLARSVGSPLVSLICKLGVFGVMYWLLYKKHGKDMMPFVFSSTLFPIILVVIFV